MHPPIFIDIYSGRQIASSDFETNLRRGISTRFWHLIWCDLDLNED